MFFYVSYILFSGLTSIWGHRRESRYPDDVGKNLTCVIKQKNHIYYFSYHKHGRGIDVKKSQMTWTQHFLLLISNNRTSSCAIDKENNHE